MVLLGRGRLFFIILAIFIFSVSLLTYIVPLIDFSVANPAWNGYTGISERLDAYILNEPLDALDRYSPSSTIVIVIPYEEYLESELESLSKFLSRGGAMLLLSDYGYGNDILEYLDAPVRIDTSGQLIDPLFKYRRKTFPKIYLFYGEAELWNISFIILNHATIPNILGNDAVILAESSSFSYYDVNFNEDHDPGEVLGPLPVLVKFRYGRGVVYVLTDPSIMLNSMVDLGDNYRLIENIVGNRTVLIDQYHLRRNIHYIIREALLSAINMIQSIYIFPYLILFLIIIITFYYKWFRRGVV